MRQNGGRLATRDGCRVEIRRARGVAVAAVSLVALSIPQRGTAQPADNTNAMAFIAAKARQVPMLRQILRGQIPATIKQDLTFSDPTGWVATYQPGGSTSTADNAFFSNAITTNGRTCFTCHQPQNDWEISPAEILAEFLLTQGKSALFQPIDAADCPTSPGATARFPDPTFRTARSQLFNRGNFRISLNAPNPLGPTDESYVTFGGNTTPEWVLRVEYDPFDCELDPEHGLPANLLSVYRRPLPSTNVAFLLRDHAGASPEKFDIMWDAREPDLEAQFVNATLFHGQTTVTPDDESIAQGVEFQSGMFTAQSYDFRAGDLTGQDGSGALGGPVDLYDWRQASVPACSLGPSGELVCDGIKVKQLLSPVVLPDGTTLSSLRVNVGSELYDAFGTLTTRNRMRQAQRESIARGEALFDGKVFIINKVAGLNDIKHPVTLEDEPGTCSTCHSNKNVLNDVASDPKRLGIMDNSSGVNVMPWTPDFPRFAFYCPTGSIPFFSNPVTSADCPGGSQANPATCDKFVTTDPGKGLITGLCKDLGKMKVPILRGVAARAPYFHGGNATTLMDVVNFYNLRFDIRLTEEQKQDLVNYLNSL
jgi:cytochrome c peroxidase